MSDDTTFVTNATKTDTDGIYTDGKGQYLKITNPVEGAPVAETEAASHDKALQGIISISKRNDDPEFNIQPRERTEIFRDAEDIRQGIGSPQHKLTKHGPA